VRLHRDGVDGVPSSDDPDRYHFNIPDNMFRLGRDARPQRDRERDVWHDGRMSANALGLVGRDSSAASNKYGTLELAPFGRIYAY